MGEPAAHMPTSSSSSLTGATDSPIFPSPLDAPPGEREITPADLPYGSSVTFTEVKPEITISIPF